MKSRTKKKNIGGGERINLKNNYRMKTANYRRDCKILKSKS